MPFRHVVMFKWNDGVAADHADQVRDGLNALPPAIEQIRSYVHGPDVGVSEGTFDYVVVADFDDVDDFRIYRAHPAHVLLIEELITGNVAERASVQYMTAGEPDAGSPDPAAGETDEELLERARRAAAAEMQAMLADPD
jgi:hypothetical protein